MNTPPLIETARTLEATAQNTRALLRQLEELRDNLTSRVAQLSNAVERLRDQASALERLLGETNLGLETLSLVVSDPFVSTVAS
jgi:ABC-type transporter Mla subunit MlaD